MLSRMVGAEGMLTNTEWERLSHERKVAWLAGLTDLQVRAQASVRRRQAGRRWTR
jgi:hypothetical protein